MKNFSDLTAIETALFDEYISAGQYYLLTGSGVSLDSSGPSGYMRSAAKLTSDLVSRFDLPPSASLQQAYGYAGEDVRKVEITEHYTCEKAGNTIKRIVSHPWKRIYTFNVDDCFEKAFSEYSKAHSFRDDEFETLNFDDNYSDLSPERRASIVHLHGVVTSPERGYVFSRDEYAKIMARPNAWMLTLTQLMQSDPFIISGTTLEEQDVAFYLQIRSKEKIRTDIPPSILIEPYPNKLTYKLCEDHGFYLFEGTTLNFFEEITRRFGDSANFWRDTKRDVIDRLSGERAERTKFAASFELVPSKCDIDENPGRFLLGSELDWNLLASKIDISRDIKPSLQTEILKCARDDSNRIFLIFDEPGSGKTALLRRIAFDIAKTNKYVFWHTGFTKIEPTLFGNMIDKIDDVCFVFVDNWADHFPFIIESLSVIKKKNIVFVGTERSYRTPYIENGMSDEEYLYVRDQAELTLGEALELINVTEFEGLSTLGRMSEGEKQRRASEVEGEPIAISACRIQNNFRPFDSIVDAIIKDAKRDVVTAYGTAAIARFCYSGGVSLTVLNAATGTNTQKLLDPNTSILPIKFIDRSHKFVSPRRTVVADRVLSILCHNELEFVADMFVTLANTLAPYVNRQQIKARSPEARLSGRLLDYDQVVKKYIDSYAEYFYAEIKDNWGWNSRYWEQLALLRLDRYLSDKSNKILLDESIQHARFAYSIEKHPLSLTTLSKLLFTAMTEDQSHLKELFEEGWNLILDAIEIESRWVNVRATAFVVCFNGVLSYIDAGGGLDGSQTEKLRDVISTTYSRRLQDKKMKLLREQVQAHVR